MAAVTLTITLALVAVLLPVTQCRRAAVQPKESYDNTHCFTGVYDYDNCPEKDTLLACVTCCSELRTYYEKPPSKNVCLAACADRFHKLGLEWIYP